MIFKLMFSLLIISCLTNDPAIATEPKLLKSNQTSALNLNRYLARKPQSIVLFKGNQTKSDPTGKEYDVCFQIIPFPWETAVEGTVVNGLSMNFDSPLDGFARFELLPKDWERYKNTVMFSQKHISDRIFEVNLYPGQTCWDFLQKKSRTTQYLDLSPNGFITRATSLGYLKWSETSPDRASIYSRLIDLNFFENAPEDSLVAVRLFDPNGKFPKRNIQRRIQSVSFSKTGDLALGPFEMIVVTRKDNDLPSANLIAEEFDRESCFVTQVSPRMFVLLVHMDANTFYQLLRLLLTVGYPEQED